ncbi:flippase [Candidatus Woesearchaeota archaeon]|nr:flippase [Candidatus Woesearchaeota archaeon]
MNHKKSLLEGTFYILVTSLAAGGVSYFIRLLLARNLSLENYGLYYSVFSFVSVFLLFRDLGLSNALVRTIAKLKVENKFWDIKTAIMAVLTMQTISSSIIFLGLFFSADYLSVYFFKKPEAAILIRLFFLYIYASIISLLVKNVLLGLQKNKTYSLYEPLKNIATLLTIFTGIYLTKEVYLPLIGYSVGWIVAAFLVFSIWKEINLFKYPLITFFLRAKKLFLFGVPLFLSEVGGKLIENINTLMLTYYTNLELVGIYQIAFPSAMLFMFLSNGISTLILPISSTLWAQKDNKTMSNLIEEIYKATFLLIIPFFVVAIMNSKLLLYYLFGEKFLSATIPLQILLLGALFLFISDVNSRIILGFGKSKLIFFITLISAAINIPLNYFLIKELNIVGTSIATTVSYAIIFIASFYYLKKFINIQISTLWFVKSIFITLLIIVLSSYISISIETNLLRLILSFTACSAVILLANITYLKKLAFLFFQRQVN